MKKIKISKELYADVGAYIRARLAPCEPTEARFSVSYALLSRHAQEKPKESKIRDGGAAPRLARLKKENSEPLFEPCESAAEDGDFLPVASDICGVPDIEKLIGERDESFTEALLRLIDEREMTDAQCYKAAGVDRKLFSKIRSDKNYHPSKSTALAFAIALSLSIEESEHLLKCAGFAFSDSSVFDIIVRYFIERGQYDINLVNDTLYSYDQKLLGV